MKKALDNRNLSPEQQEVLRQKAVAAVLTGEKQVQVARTLGVSTWSVCNWVKQARKRGVGSLKAKPRGGCKPAALKGWQAARIVDIIREKNPDQLKLPLPYVLWTREAVQKLIFQKYGIKLALRTISDYLARWGMTPQKPVSRAYEQNPEAVRRWLEEEYPAIAARAKKEKGLLFWEDEMGLRSEHVVGRGFSPKGVKPVLEKTGNRFGCNMISAISNLGKLYFSIFEGGFNTPVFLDFLKRLIQQNKGRKIFLIADGHPVHKAGLIKDWLKENKSRIELFILPGYSPERNPDELLNQELKATVFRSKRPANKTELKALLHRRLCQIQKNPDKIQAYFQAKYTAYAAA
jgi:transposase